MPSARWSTPTSGTRPRSREGWHGPALDPAVSRHRAGTVVLTQWAADAAWAAFAVGLRPRLAAVFFVVFPPFARALNSIHILTGFPLGYWLSSQGSIALFVVLIFVYALMMNNVIDRKYGFEEEEEE